MFDALTVNLDRVEYAVAEKMLADLCQLRNLKESEACHMIGLNHNTWCTWRQRKEPIKRYVAIAFQYAIDQARPSDVKPMPLNTDDVLKLLRSAAANGERELVQKLATML